MTNYDRAHTTCQLVVKNLRFEDPCRYIKKVTIPSRNSIFHISIFLIGDLNIELISLIKDLLHLLFFKEVLTRII